MAAKRQRRAQYFTDVAIIEPGRAVFTGHYYALEDSEDLRTTVREVRNGQWSSRKDVSGVAHSIRFTTESEWQLLLLERSRALYRITERGIAFEWIDEDGEGFLMDLRRIGRHWYTVGGHHQIWREERGRWVRFDDGVRVPGEPGEGKLLLSIDGLAEDDIYTVGFGGVILHYDGSAWRELNSPTNCGLQRVLPVTPDEVYVCGYGNALYRGNPRGWRALTEPDDSVVYWDMAHLQGRVYVCTKSMLYVIVDDALEEVSGPVPGPLGFYRLAANETELWSCGNECVLRFNGKDWTQYVFPDNI